MIDRIIERIRADYGKNNINLCGCFITCNICIQGRKMIDEIMSELKHEIKEHNADTFESKIFNSGILCAMGIVAKYGKCDNINRGCVDPINFNNRRLAENVSEDDGK